VFIALSPFIALEPLTAWRDVGANRAIVVDRAGALGAFGPALRYAGMVWHDSMGIPIVVLGGIGAVWMIGVAPAQAVLLLAFPLPFFAFISHTVPASRYLNPLLPFVAIFAAWTLTSIASRLNARPWMFWGAAAACVLPAVIASIGADLFFRQTDTRTLARDYIERNVPPGSTLMLQPYSTPLTQSREALVEALTRHVGGPEAASTKFQVQLSLDPYPAPAYRLIYLGRGGLDVDRLYVDPSELVRGQGLSALRRLGVAFVVLKRYNDSDQELAPFIAALARGARRIAVFSPYRPGVTEAERARIAPFLHNTDTRIDKALERPGPPLEIWQLDGTGS
jgi:hypothetical protein